MDISTNYVSSVQIKSKHLEDQKPKDVIIPNLLGKYPCIYIGDVYLKSFQRICYLHVTKLAAGYNTAVK
jgi:hypothetical protein